MPKRILKGVVVSDKNEKTVTVKVDRRVRHPIYQKIITKSKKYHAHDEKNHFKEGDVVSIVETAPISKSKKWTVIYSDTAETKQEPARNQQKKATTSVKKAPKKK